MYNHAMDPALVVSNLLNPPILFFFLGVAAALLRSDLEIPAPIARFLSLYLLLAIGFHGGVELTRRGLDTTVTLTLIAAVLMALAVPLYTFFILRRRVDVYDAAAIAATYGSISAVTFITAASFLTAQGIPYGGHMVAAMALMESPAIVVGVILVRLYRPAEGDRQFDVSWSALGRDAFLNASVYILLGSLLIGALTGERGYQVMSPLVGDLFQPVLALFLLDLGIVAAGRLSDLRKSGAFLLGFAIIVPVVNALIGIVLARLIGLAEGDALMFAILCAGASYIAVPAAIRIAVPEARPTVYVPMALAVTFPFNIIIGIPLYMAIIRQWWS
jgi:uncharacterized protein